MESNVSELYGLYLPFSFSPGRQILEDTIPTECDFGGRKVSLNVLPAGYVIRVEGFTSPETASAFFPKLRDALLWTSLSRFAGIHCPTQISPITEIARKIADEDHDPVARIARSKGWGNVHGIYTGDDVVVYNLRNNYITITGNSVNLIVKTPSQTFLSDVEATLNLLSLGDISAKNRLAVEVHNASLFEENGKVRFIQMITSLEALLKDVPLAESAERARKLTLANLQSQRNEAPVTERADFDSLISALGNQKRKSIRSRQNALIKEAIDQDPTLGTLEQLSGQLKLVSDVRNTLVHTGKTTEKFEQAYSFLTMFLPRVLKLQWN